MEKYQVVKSSVKSRFFFFSLLVYLLNDAINKIKDKMLNYYYFYKGEKNTSTFITLLLKYY